MMTGELRTMLATPWNMLTAFEHDTVLEHAAKTRAVAVVDLAKRQLAVGQSISMDTVGLAAVCWTIL